MPSPTLCAHCQTLPSERTTINTAPVSATARTASPSQAFRPGTTSSHRPPPSRPAARPTTGWNHCVTSFSFSLTYSRATLALLSTRYSRPPCVNTSCHIDPPFALACSTHGTRHLLIFRVPTARTATTSTTVPRSGSSKSLAARYGGCASVLAVFLNTTRPKLLLRSSLTGTPLASSTLHHRLRVCVIRDPPPAPPSSQVSHLTGISPYASAGRLPALGRCP